MLVPSPSGRATTHPQSQIRVLLAELESLAMVSLGQDSGTGQLRTLRIYTVPSQVCSTNHSSRPSSAMKCVRNAFTSVAIFYACRDILRSKLCGSPVTI